MPSRPIILITGATGNQGGAAARELLKNGGFTIRAMTRHPDGEKARELKKLGAEVIGGDLDDPASLEKAMQDAWGVLGVQNTWEAGVEREEEQGHREAKIAKKAGVHHYVYASVGSAHRNTGIPHFDNKFRIEETVRSLGFPSYTIYRPAFFMENWLSPWFKPGIDQGKLMIALTPATKLQMIAVRDVGKYAAYAFTHQEKLNGRAIDIAGDELTMPQVAAEISKAAGRKVEFVPIPIEEVRKGSEDFAIMLEWFDRVGYNADIRKMSMESGIKPTRFSEWAHAMKW